jgi:hypothetical protein
VLDTGESSILFSFGLRWDDVWMPAFAGMTVLMTVSAIMTQSLDPESRKYLAKLDSRLRD